MILPVVCDALWVRWRAICDQVALPVDQVFDGPQATYVGTDGIAVGATVTDTKAEFDYPSRDPHGDTERDIAPCLIWSGSGETVFKPRRDRVAEIYNLLRTDLNRDPTIGGVVTFARITGGLLAQNQVGGALVTCEFRVQFEQV